MGLVADLNLLKHHRQWRSVGDEAALAVAVDSEAEDVADSVEALATVVALAIVAGSVVDLLAVDLATEVSPTPASVHIGDN